MHAPHKSPIPYRNDRHMDMSRATSSRPRAAASLSGPVDIEACSTANAVITPPISNEPHQARRGRAAPHSIPFVAAASSPYGAAAPPHSAATSNEPEASQCSITAPRNIYDSEASHDNVAVARSPTFDELQRAGGSREPQDDNSFVSRLYSFPSAMLPTEGMAAMGGHSYSKSFTSRKR